MDLVPANNRVTFEWLRALGFSQCDQIESFESYSKVLEPSDADAAILEIAIGRLGDAWHVCLWQNTPGKPYVEDDVVALTTLPSDLRQQHVVKLLMALNGE